MSTPDYEVADRRPIATRELAISQRAAAWLVAAGVTANAISVAGMISGILSGAALAATQIAPNFAWLGWLLGAVFIQLRLLANMLDGMVAVRSGQASRVGELYNEVPDRVSDAATFIGLGYALGSHVTLGYIAACMAIFVAYVRAMGKVAGGPQEFCGPMAKPQRMAAATITALICCFLPQAAEMHLPAIALAVIVLGSAVTAIRRLLRISAALHAR
jgi:phosphatidylglycerophosphate synthase